MLANLYDMLLLPHHCSNRLSLVVFPETLQLPSRLVPMPRGPSRLQTSLFLKSAFLDLISLGYLLLGLPSASMQMQLPNLVLRRTSLSPPQSPCLNCSSLSPPLKVKAPPRLTRKTLVSHPLYILPIFSLLTDLYSHQTRRWCFSHADRPCRSPLDSSPRSWSEDPEWPRRSNCLCQP